MNDKSVDALVQSVRILLSLVVRVTTLAIIESKLHSEIEHV